MKIKFRKYGFPQDVIETIKPIVQMVIQNDIAEAEEEIAKLALKVCEGMEKKSLSPKRGNEYFTLLELNLPNDSSSLKLRKETQDLIFEGNILHDYGKEYGADIVLMRTLARRILGMRSPSSEC